MPVTNEIKLIPGIDGLTGETTAGNMLKGQGFMGFGLPRLALPASH